NDNEKPTIACPANKLVNTDVGLCTASNVNLGTPTTADNCAVATISNNAPATYPKGTSTVTWAVTDTSGNSATCTQTVTINDNERSEERCVGKKSVNTDAGLCRASNVNLGTATTADNCAVATISNNAPGTYPKGTRTV